MRILRHTVKAGSNDVIRVTIRPIVPDENPVEPDRVAITVNGVTTDSQANPELIGWEGGDDSAVLDIQAGKLSPAGAGYATVRVWIAGYELVPYSPCTAERLWVTVC